MEEDKKDVNEQKNFLQLLKKLTEVQTEMAKIEAQLAIREGKDQVKSVIADTRSKMEEQAKEFGVSLKNMEKQYSNNQKDKKEITDDYKGVLSEINEQYSAILKTILENKSQLEADEQTTMIEQKQSRIEQKKSKREFKKRTESLKAEIDKATNDDNFELAKQKIEELKQLKEENKETSEEIETQIKQLEETRKQIREKIKKCEAEFENTKCERKDELIKVTEDKNNKLAKIEKQNIFQKIVGGIFNKFNGTKKFLKGVIEPLKAKVTKIKEESIPQVKQKVSNKIQTFSENMKEAKDFVVDGAKSVKTEAKVKLGQAKDGVATHITSAVNTGKETYKSVIAKGTKIKNDKIAQMEASLEQKQQKLLEKTQLLNEKSNKEAEIE